MKIKKGDWFRCIKTLTMDGDIMYTKGGYYKSEKDKCITNNLVSVNHIWTSAINNGYFVKLYTIQDLKDGKVAVENDGTLEELKKVLDLSNPDDNFSIKGSYSIYECAGRYWGGVDRTKLPTQSVKDFLVQLPNEDKDPFKELKDQINNQSTRVTINCFDSTTIPLLRVSGGRVIAGEIKSHGKNAQWQPKVGEIVECKFAKTSSLWHEAEYLATDKESKYPHAIVEVGANGFRSIETVLEIRPVTKKQKVTKQEIADHLGINVESLEIID